MANSRIAKLSKAIEDLAMTDTGGSGKVLVSKAWLLATLQAFRALLTSNPTADDR